MLKKEKQVLNIINTINIDNFSILELSKMANCNERTFRTYLYKLNIKKKICFVKSKKCKEKVETIKELINKKYTQKQISKYFNQSVRQITIFCDHFKIKNPNKTSYFQFSEIEKQIFLGSLLGDGHISQGRLRVSHSSKQKEYIEYKINLLQRLISNTKNNIPRYDKRTNKTYYKCSFDTVVTQEGKNFEKEWYIPKKQVPLSIYGLTSLGLAIWFMDDGYKNGNSINIATNCFNSKSIFILLDMLFKNFNINATSNNKDNIIYIPLKEYSKFYDIILSHMVPSMMYKLPKKTNPFKIRKKVIIDNKIFPSLQMGTKYLGISVSYISGILNNRYPKTKYNIKYYNNIIKNEN